MSTAEVFLILLVRRQPQMIRSDAELVTASVVDLKPHWYRAVRELICNPVYVESLAFVANYAVAARAVNRTGPYGASAELRRMRWNGTVELDVVDESIFERGEIADAARWPGSAVAAEP